MQNGVLPLALRLGGFIGGALALGFVYAPNDVLDWFLIQLALGGLAFVPLRGTVLGAVLSGAWLPYFWIPAAIGALTALGILTAT